MPNKYIALAGKWTGYAVTKRTKPTPNTVKLPNDILITNPDGTNGAMQRNHLRPVSKNMERIQVYPSRKVKGQWGWRYKARNGRKVATSGELYTKRSHALDMVHHLFGYKVATGAAFIEVLTK